MLTAEFLRLGIRDLLNWFERSILIMSLGMGNLELAVVFPSEDGKAVRRGRGEKGRTLIE